MASATTNPPKVWTTEDLLAMPDDGVRRWIINGQLREELPEFPEVKMTVRNRHHCQIMVNAGTMLKYWVRSQPQPRGNVYCGEVGVIFPGRDTTIGIDVVYASADMVAAQSDKKTTMLDGVPTLAIEILSPTVTQEQIEEKIEAYLDAGVSLVWTINPYRRTVTIDRPGQPSVLFNVTQRLPEYPEMPGFAPAVAELFE
jgi:Uma2 family endonuclease